MTPARGDDLLDRLEELTRRLESAVDNLEKEAAAVEPEGDG